MNKTILSKQEITWITGYMQACARGENYYAPDPTDKVAEYIESGKLCGKDLNVYILEVLLNIRNILIDKEMTNDTK